MMYPNIKHSLDIETNGSYSKAVTGIIIITLAFSVGLIILGVWEPEQNGIQQENIKIPFVPENKFSDESSSEPTSSEDLSEEIRSSSETTEEEFSDAVISGLSDVPVLECGAVCDLDTEAGTLEITREVLPTEPLPLCIDQDYLNQWKVLVESYGGYEFQDGLMVIEQKDLPDQYIRIIKVDSFFQHPYMEYVLGFELIDPEHPIVLESNHVPTIIGDWFCVIPDKELDKRVDLRFMTTWTGCFLPEQEFLVILAHKTMSQK
ncbi:MAG: hypothetical protein HWN81_21285 [Candidatus Lokiarchaeota archaeon]|nr:hypothetical protein [Candidatus Lokiarchaeota archaeon]